MSPWGSAASPGGPCDSPVTAVPGRARAFRDAVGCGPRVRHVAVDVATSAFAGEPQPVEIYHRGMWYSGHLLGWRHDSDGRCLARVSCVVGKLKHKAWKDLADLRLPDGAADSPLGWFAEPATRRIDDLPEPGDDETRPHVLLADLRVRPRKPPHAVAPPPVELKPRADEPMPEEAPVRRPVVRPVVRTVERPRATVDPRWTVTRDWLSAV
jgi:hypothetical protein